MSNILVTGAAGFIGYHVCQRLLARGDAVIGLDNLCDYYDVRLKTARLDELYKQTGFAFHKLDVSSGPGIEGLFAGRQFDAVVHLAAQVGVRYSLENPLAYIDSNLAGFTQLLEACRRAQVKHLVFASSSSVYGANTHMPYSVRDSVDHPVSLYAATKRAGELLAHSYSAMFGLPATGLRFFTVYGPWGRPDMAMFRFTEAILAGRPIDVYNAGNMQRDFTYVDDVAEAVVRVLDRPPVATPAWSADASTPADSFAPFRIYNVGHHQPVDLLRLIEVLEGALGLTAQKNLLPMQPGDLPATWADISDLTRDFDFTPSTPIEEGVPRFVEWYRAYYTG
jgi:UDP-glucuronate 4-epimerase